MPQSPTKASALADPWDPRGGHLPLDGVLERERFPPIMTALLFPVLAFVLTNVVVLPLFAIALPLVSKGMDPAQLADAARSLSARSDFTLIANSVGQVLGLAVPALLVARWHSSRWKGFLRLRRCDVRLMGLALLGWAALYPVVTWLGTVNQVMPLPDFLEKFDHYQAKLIEQLLMSDQGVIFNLLTLAVTPAICEEILFRGYVQRQGERALGAAGGILFTGAFFGCFHLRFSQVLPLAALGCYLAYLVWRTGSLWPAMFVHLANNAFAVAAGAYTKAQPGITPEEVDQMQLPWYVVGFGAVLFAGLALALHRFAPCLRSRSSVAA